RLMAQVVGVVIDAGVPRMIHPLAPHAELADRGHVRGALGHVARAPSTTRELRRGVLLRAPALPLLGRRLGVWIAVEHLGGMRKIRDLGAIDRPIGAALVVA